MLSRFYCTCRTLGSASWLPLFVCSLLSACGGGGSSSGPSAVASSSVATSAMVSSSQVNNSLSSLFTSSSSSLSSVSVQQVTLSGRVTYDRVPHNPDHIGLNYNAIQAMPVRGALVELLNSSGSIIATTSTDGAGDYSLRAPQNTLVKVRVKAQLLRTQSPTWDFKVTDNTSGNAIYALLGSSVTSGTGNSQRNMHASSGWNGSAYAGTRAAAPFAILDNIYNGSERLSAAGNLANLIPLELRWSTKNKAADGNVSLGEVGTSYFDGDDTAIYILGDANNDADEYDSHVISHEWGHYLEQNLFRGDSLGGSHTQNDVLDMRVSMSEGFANAFASMLLDDPYYADSSGAGGSEGFFIDIGRRNNSLKGSYSEDSIGSIFYNYYLSANNKTGSDFSPIIQVLSDSGYIANDAVTSIYLFYAQLKALLPGQAAEFNALMLEQDIFGTNEYAENEINDAGYAAGLPLYRTLQANGAVVNVCSSAEFGKYNKYANSQLLVLNIAQAKSYSFSLVKSGGAPVSSRPEMVVSRRGAFVKWFSNTVNGQATGSVNLVPGTYIVEAYDDNNRTETNTQENTTCFNIQVIPN